MAGNPLKSKREEPEVDFSYLEKYGNRETFQIPCCLDLDKLKGNEEIFETQVTNIYDPSKFWMIVKYDEFDAFMTYLFRFYYQNWDRYKVPRDKVRVGLYCVICKSNSYLRGVIVQMPIPEMNIGVVHVFLIDIGCIKTTDVENVCYMSEEILQVPKFAVRSCLAGICPKRDKFWTRNIVREFSNLIRSSTTVFNIVNIDKEREVLEGCLAVIRESGKLTRVHEFLISADLAEYCYDAFKLPPNDNDDSSKYSYLYPSFEMLESGQIFASVFDVNFFDRTSLRILEHYNGTRPSNKKKLFSILGKCTYAKKTNIMSESV